MQESSLKEERGVEQYHAYNNKYCDNTPNNFDYFFVASAPHNSWCIIS